MRFVVKTKLISTDFLWKYNECVCNEFICYPTNEIDITNRICVKKQLLIFLSFDYRFAMCEPQIYKYISHWFTCCYYLFLVSVKTYIKLGYSSHSFVYMPWYFSIKYQWWLCNYYSKTQWLLFLVDVFQGKKVLYF